METPEVWGNYGNYWSLSWVFGATERNSCRGKKGRYLYIKILGILFQILLLSQGDPQYTVSQTEAKRRRDTGDYSHFYLNTCSVYICIPVSHREPLHSAKKLSLPWHDSFDLLQTVTWDVFPHRREAGKFTALSDEQQWVQFLNAALSYWKKQHKNQDCFS